MQEVEYVNNIQAKMCKDLIEINRELLVDIETEVSIKNKYKLESIRRSLSYISGCVDGDIE